MESVCSVSPSVKEVWSQRDQWLATQLQENDWMLLPRDFQISGALRGAARIAQSMESPSRQACAVLLSDDGTVADYQKLRPLCEKKGVPFVLAIVRDFVGRKDGSGYMSIAQLREMADLGCELISHSKSHRHLSALSQREIRQEIEDSVYWMRDQGWDSKHFVYPFGAHNATVEREVARLCECACVVKGGVAKPPFPKTRVPRQAFGSFCKHSVRTFEAYCSLVDEAARERRLLVWMLHPAHQTHDDEQQAILGDLIDYMRNAGVEIATLSEAWTQHKNLLEIAEDHFQLLLDADGFLWEAGFRFPVIAGAMQTLAETQGLNQLLRAARSFRSSLKEHVAKWGARKTGK